MTETHAPSHSDSIPDGYRALSQAEAHARVAQYGDNTIFHVRRDRPFIAFLKKFQSPLLILLMGAVAVSFYVHEFVSGSIIALMIILSAVLDFVNSYRSEQVAEALAQKIVTTATVFRDGVRKEVPFRSIVPGDLIYLAAGSVIPADGVLIRGDDVFVNQSALTGESFPVGKISYTGSPDTASTFELRADVPQALFMGTSMVTGFGTMLATHTGARAEFGRIAARLASENTETAFDRGVRSFSLFIMQIAIVMVVVVFGFNALKGEIGVFESLLFAIAIAVGLTPELLPVVLTVTLSRGSMRMAAKHVVVRHLASIQNFGAMTVLATDKTGTLTEDRITLVRCVDFAGREADAVFHAAYVSSAFMTARQNPLDVAIKAHHTVDLSAYTKVDEIPFDFERKRASIVYDREQVRTLVSKGAPEELMAACAAVRDVSGMRAFDQIARTTALAQYNALSRDGYRVLAIAERSLPLDETHEYAREVEHDLTFLGFAAFYDPPKATAGEAIRDLESLSIDVKIVTGDSEQLTERVCKEIGLVVRGTMTGSEVAAMSDEELTHHVRDVTIFARVTPEEKERVIAALRRAGETVGYLGDGINDAPALKSADVGISVNNAVDVAKETADIILLRKSLEVLVDGVREGRITFENTMKYIRMGFSSNFGNMVSMLVASLFLPFLPMLPAQILINNFLYDLSQTALPTDRVDPAAVRVPISWDMRAIKRYMLIFGLVSSVFDVVTFIILYKVFGLAGAAFQTGWFIESIATQVLVVHIIRTRGFLFAQSKPSRSLVISTSVVIGAAFLIPYLPLAVHAGFIPLAPSILLAICCIVGVYLVVAEGAKRMYLRIEARVAMSAASR